MFCALKGATTTPRRASARHKPVTTSDLPTSEDVPAIRTPLDVPVALPTGAVYGVSIWRPPLAGTVATMFGLRGRYRIVTYSGVVVQDEGNVTSTGLRIASASAAVVVSAAVVGAALFGGSAISDSGAPNGQDERLVAVPASPSTSLAVPASPSTLLKATPSGATTRPLRARAHARPGCQSDEKPAICHRPPTRRSIATPTTRSSKSPSLAPKAAKRSTETTPKSHSTRPTTKRPTKAAGSTPTKTTTQSSSGFATRSDWANAVLAELNTERASHGLPALKMNSKLTSAAHAHNMAMAKANKLSHQLSGEAALGSRISAAGYRWSAVAENVAYNSRRSQDGVLAVQKAMYNEKPPNDGHRQNILSEGYADVGIDVINDSVHDKVWLVTDFGRP
jgi:uncharacterized protein YkwD